MVDPFFQANGCAASNESGFSRSVLISIVCGFSGCFASGGLPQADNKTIAGIMDKIPLIRKGVDR